MIMLGRNIQYEFQQKIFHFLQNEPVKFGPASYGCPYCSILMKSPELVKRHMRSHTGEKPYSCPYCEKSFTTKANCNRHTEKCVQTGEKPFACPYCTSTFTQNGSRLRHIRHHHPNMQ